MLALHVEIFCLSLFDLRMLQGDGSKNYVIYWKIDVSSISRSEKECVNCWGDSCIECCTRVSQGGLVGKDFTFDLRMLQGDGSKNYVICWKMMCQASQDWKSVCQLLG